MAQIIIAAAGAVAGSYIPGIGAVLGAQLGYALGSAISGQFKQNIAAEPQPLMDLRVLGAEYGQPIPYVFGVAQIAGQMWWNTDRRPTTTVTRTSFGGGGGFLGGLFGGGGGGSIESSSTTYDMDCLIGLSDNEIAGISRIWKNGELIYTFDASATDGSLEASINTNQWRRLTVYTGAADQLPDPTYEAVVTTSLAPAYRTRGMVFIEGLQLGGSGQIPNLQFEVVEAGSVAEIAWLPATVPLTNGFWLTVAYANGLFVACSDGGGLIGYSTDGFSWTTIPVPVGRSSFYNAIAYGNGTWIIGDRVNQFTLNSTDGINWTTGTSSASALSELKFESGQGFFLGTGSFTFSRNRATKTVDGITWSAITLPLSAGWSGIEFGNGTWVIVGSGIGLAHALALYTTDPTGETGWTLVAMPASAFWTKVAWNGNLFIAVGISGGGWTTYAQSVDGITWTAGTFPVSEQWRRIAVDSTTNGKFVAVGNTTSVYSLDDGVTWNIVPFYPTASSDGLAFGAGHFVGTGTTSRIGQVLNLTQSIAIGIGGSGLGWTARVSAGNVAWRDVTYGGGQFVAVSLSAVVMTSPDGITWTARTGAVNQNWLGVVWTGSRYVAVSNTGAFSRVQISTDGISWTLVGATSFARTWNQIATNGSTIVAIANGSDSVLGVTDSVMTSFDDGETCTLRNTPTNNQWLDVRWTASIIKAVGNSGVANRAMTSPDGVTWTLRTTPQDSDWRHVAWNGSLLVAVASAGFTTQGVMTSPDGITWTLRTTPTGSWAGVDYGNGYWVAVGFGGTVMYSADGITWALGVPAVTNQWWSVAFGANIFAAVAASGSGNRVMTSNMIDAGAFGPPLRDVVSRLCIRSGLTISQFDVSGIDIAKTIRSLALSQVAPTRQAIELLMTAYFFEMTAGDRLYFRDRGGAAVATIPYDDLAATSSEDFGEPFAIKQSSDIELPSQVALTYINYANDYQSDTQYVDRLVSATEGTVATMQIAIGLTPSEAKAIAESILTDQTTSLLGSEISVLYDYARLEPTDVVNVIDQNGATQRVRLVKRKDSFPTLTFEVVIDDASSIVSSGITSVDYISSGVVSPIVGTLMELMDIPILADSDSDSGFYAAAKGDGTPYPGSQIFSSPDDITYSVETTITESGVLGSCTTTLGDWTGPRIFDDVNTVSVDIGAGELLSSTRDAVLAAFETNLVLVGSELLQFVTATLDAPGIYTLSGLLRGARGSEWAMIGHVAAERFVLLRPAGIRRVFVTTPNLGLNRFYKGITLGGTLSSATAETFNDFGIGLKPFSPYDLRGEHDGADDITITWQRRTRLGIRVQGPLGISIPLGEEFELYDVEVYSDAGHTTLVRTFSDVPTSSVLYSLALRTSDGFSVGQTIYVRVYQLSAIVGRGYVLEQSIV